MDPFGSHVIRSLLVLLCPNLAKDDSQTHTNSTSSSALRSKKSAVWKAKQQGQMKSVFEKGKGKETVVKSLQTSPVEFQNMARRFVELVRSEMDENEIRAMAANKVASPTLQMLLEVEADQGLSNEPGSLMDRVTVGIITNCSEGKAPSEPSDYVNTLLRDTTSSHLLETIISLCPDQAFNVLWDLYLTDKLLRLAVHPVANFVVAKALERASQEQLASACQELNESWAKVITASRSGVLRAALDRAAKLQALGEEVGGAVFSAFGLQTAQERLSLIPCALVLLSLKEYNRMKSEESIEPKGSTRPYGKGKGHVNPLEPKVQGSLLLQSLLYLPEPHNRIIIDSLKSLPMEERIALAHHSVSSRVYDVFLSSPSIPAKEKRSFIIDFIGHYHQLVDDRFGSRVVDRCWEFADTYLKEKIARSLIQHEQFLVGSYFGKYFARNLNLYLLQRKPDQWRALQSEKKKQIDGNVNHLSTTMQPRDNTVSSPQSEVKTGSHDQGEKTKKKKRKRQDDEIDAVFSSSLGKKVKKGALTGEPSVPTTTIYDSEGRKVDKELQDVLGAIKAAPSGEKVKGKRRWG